MTDFDGDSHYHSLPGIRAARIVTYPKRRPSRGARPTSTDAGRSILPGRADEPHYEDFLVTKADEQEVG